ncbi:unnamed protein product, partial [Onchocerca ochengi]|uniref:Uncharacterized protein n=1 Tax=Onchocerca ochengi TaxID=42157 RepID=A0A182ER93_ONCOC
MDAWLAKR